MDYFSVFILSVVEGITEFLPVSSTGHLILTSKLLGLPDTEFLKTFEIAIQFGAIMSVLFLYWKKLLVEREVFLKTILVFIPTALLGFLLYQFIKMYLLGNAMITVATLIIGGVLIIIIEKYFSKKEPKGTIVDMSVRKALLLGVIQTLSVIPGVSRSGATIFGGMFLGLSRKEATELSFLVALPVMSVATGYDIVKNINTFSPSDITMLFWGMLISFLTAVIAIKWLLGYVKTHNFVFFGIYRIIIGIIFLLFFL